jgi:hypothetical protein
MERRPVRPKTGQKRTNCERWLGLSRIPTPRAMEHETEGLQKGSGVRCVVYACTQPAGDISRRVLVQTS